MKKIYIALFGLAVAMVIPLSVQKAMAYFTTFAQAEGGYEITLGDTDITEEFSNWTKHVVISNSEDAQPVYVRALALAGSQYELIYQGDGWTNGGDGYYYYDTILEAGQKTSELQVKIENVPKNPQLDDNFNVVVLYESAPVQYDEDGNPYADWNLKVGGE